MYNFAHLLRPALSVWRHRLTPQFPTLAFSPAHPYPHTPVPTPLPTPFHTPYPPSTLPMHKHIHTSSNTHCPPPTTHKHTHAGMHIQHACTHTPILRWSKECIFLLILPYGELRKEKLPTALGLQLLPLFVSHLLLSQSKEKSRGRSGPEFHRCHWNAATVQGHQELASSSISLWQEKTHFLFNYLDRNYSFLHPRGEQPGLLQSNSATLGFSPIREILTTLSLSLQWFSHCLGDR